MEDVRPRAELRWPGQGEGALDRLHGSDLPHRPAFGRVVGADQHVGTGVVPGPVRLPRDLDPAEPLDAGAPHPAGHQRPHGEPVVPRQRLAVQLVGEKHVGERLLRREGPPESPLRRLGIEPDEQDRGRGRGDPRQLQHVGEAGAAPDAVPDAAGTPLGAFGGAALHPVEHRAVVPGALEIRGQLLRRQGADPFVGNLDRFLHRVALDDEAPVGFVNPQAAAVVPDEEQVVRGDHSRHVFETRFETVPVLDEGRRVLEEGRDLRGFRRRRGNRCRRGWRRGRGGRFGVAAGGEHRGRSAGQQPFQEPAAAREWRVCGPVHGPIIGNGVFRCDVHGVPGAPVDNGGGPVDNGGGPVDIRGRLAGTPVDNGEAPVDIGGRLMEGPVDNGGASGSAAASRGRRSGR